MTAMALEDLKEAYAGHVIPNPEHLTKTLAFVVSNPDCLCLVAEQDGKLIGMIGAMRHVHHVSGEIGVGELLWWVDPTHRDARGPGLTLFRTMERWAKESGAKWLTGIAPTKETEAAYKAMGFVPIETVFQRRLA